MMKRIASILLSALMLLSALGTTACSTPDPAVDTTAADTTAAPAPDTTTVEETTADPLADNLPEADYDGYTFRIGASGQEMEWIGYLIRPEQNGEVLNDAIYKANLAVAERFDINFEHIPLSGTNFGTMDVVIQNAKAGEDAYDLVTQHDIQSTKGTLQGVYRNVHDLEHIDLSRPWWPVHTTNALTVNGKMYVIANSMSYYGLYSTRCLFFNKGLMKDLGIEYPYEDVRNGTWYLDDLITMTKDIYSDLDNDGARSLNDRYGFAITGTAYCFLECFGIDAFGKDENGFLTDTFYNERNVSAVEKSNAWFFGGTQGAYFKSSHAGYFEPDSALIMFANGNVLFGFNSVGRQTQACMDSDVEFGIVPMPKLDEAQQDYISGCVDNPICVPITNKNMDRTGMIVEAMSAEGYRSVQPAYTETVMKERYASDKDSVEMLDIIFNGRMLAAGYLYNTDSSARMQTSHHDMWKLGTSNINLTSYYNKCVKVIESRLKSINDFFAAEQE